MSKTDTRIRFIASSLAMRKKLNRLDDRVDQITVDGHTLTLTAGKFSVYLDVEARLHEKITLNQASRRWDWVKQLMNQIDDQPLTFNVTESSLDIMFTY